MTDDKAEENTVDPFIETEKKLLALENDVSILKKQLKEKEVMMNKVIATNKQLLTELNNIPAQPQVPKKSYANAAEEAFYKQLGINKEK